MSNTNSPADEKNFDTQIDGRSSVLEKVEPAMRQKIHRALIDRDPPTYRAVFDKFNLSARNVSYTAFYYYARRIRTQGALIEQARLEIPGGKVPHDVLPDILAARLLETLLDENTTPTAIQQLTNAWRLAANVQTARLRLAQALADGKRSESRAELDDLCNMMKKYAGIRRDELKIEQPCASSEGAGSTS